MKKITLLLLFLFSSISGYSQLSLEGFENTTGPDAFPSTNWTLGTGNWAVFDNGVSGTTTNARWEINSAITTPVSVYQGVNAAYVDRENINDGNTSEEFLATPPVLIPANGVLNFYTRMNTTGNQGTIYQIRVAPATASQTDPFAYSLVEQWTEDQLIVPTSNFNIYTEKTVDLSAFATQFVYVSFVKIFSQTGTGIGGDRWFIDNVSIDSPCLTPTGLTVSAITSNSASLNWVNPNGTGSASYEIEVVLASGTPTGIPTNTTVTFPYIVTGLLPNTAYKFYVRARCTTGFASPWSVASANFTTSVAPPVCGGNFVDSGGVGANYGNNANITTTICPVNPGDLVTVTFTAFNTENGVDLLKVYDGNDATAPLLATLSGTALPPAYTASSANGCLTFVFTSNGTTTAAGWASNVTCAPPPSCRKPTALASSAITSNSVTLSWLQPANPDTSVASAWQVLALPCGSLPPTAGSTGFVSATTNPFTLSGLTSATCYDIYVRAFCSVTDSSSWAGPTTITTQLSPPVCGGNFVDTGGLAANYPNNANQTTTICPVNAGDVVTVTFTSFNTQANTDFLKIYDGNDTTAPLLANLSGTTLPPSFTSSAASGCLTFVFTSNGTTTAAGWVSNITCAAPPVCRNPTTLASNSVLSSSVVLNWVQPINPDTTVASSWHVLALPCGSPAPTAASTGFVTASSNPFTLTGLSPTTCYDIYIRAACSVTDFSTWTGPATITTQIAPPVCGGNFVDVGGPTANYPNSSDSTVTICPVNAGDVVTVTFTSFNTEATWDGLYVFNGNSITAPQIASANPGGNVPGGLAGSYWGTTIPGPFTSTSPDGCLTFRFRSDGAVNNPGWVSNVTCAPPPTCIAPSPITAGTITSNSVILNWTQPANPDTTVASAWQVLALPCGSPAPTAASTGFVDVTTNPFILTGLSSATCYDIYVRAVCSETDNSSWGGPTTITTQVAPPVCGGNFVDAGGPTANYPNSSDSTVTICPVNAGDVVTVTFTSFNTEATWDGLYVFNGNSITAPQIASANPAGNVPGGLAGSYWGTAIPGPFTSTSPDGCLTFRFRSDGSVNNPGWVSNVTCALPPTCIAPTAITSNTLTHNSVTLNWTQPVNPDTSIASAWQVLALPCGSPLPTAVSTGFVNVSTNPFTLTGLIPATCYDIYIRAVCSPTDSSAWGGPRTVTTLVAPPVCGGVFTDEGGATANYNNSSNVTTIICPTNPGEIVTVTFTAFDTEANWDGLYVYDGNTVNPATQIASANPPANVPGGIAGSYWGTTIPGPFTSTSGDGCLTFVFRSDGSVNRPGWVSNVTCSPAPSCIRPSQLSATGTTQTSAILSWTQLPNPDGSTATAWEILILPAGSPIPTGPGIPATSPYTVNGLNPGTSYVFYVRAICSPTDASDWSAFNFATLPVNDACDNATFAIVNQNLNCVQTTPGTLAGATASLPATTCGGAGAANDDVWFTFTATTVTHVISFTNVTPATALSYAIYQGTCTGGLTEVGCNTGAGLVAGTTYYIRVFSTGTVPVFTNFNLCIGTLPCTEAPAFCTGQTVTYTNATNVPSLGQIGCLFTSPNPAFFFLQVNQAGPLSYLISQVDNGGVPRDVDYVAWGPFTDLNTACSGVPANPLPAANPIPTPTTGCPGTIHACSYSTAPQEIMCIPNAQLCEVYVIMITNFSNQAGTVTFTQTNIGGGGGTTACFPINTFNYSQTNYCQNQPNPTPVLAPGASAGVYTSTPGLVIDSVTGTIDLLASTPGAYVVTSTSATTIGGVCTTIPFITTTRTVIITAPANATISYPAATYCNNITSAQGIVRTGTAGGTYSSTPAGLLINAITGEIIPVASSGGVYTVTYTIPATGGCTAFTSTTQVEIIDAPVPTFTQVAPICPGDALADLPTSSNDSPPITGTWSPVINNTATTTYTFTPTAGQCAEITTMTINVGSTTPTFNAVAPICPGAPLTALPTTSLNGIDGFWTPSLDNTQTTTYTFTPTSGVCVGSTTLTIEVLSPTIVPTFNAVSPICPNGTISPLPTTSLNGITGVWSPALDNTQTTTYTFTPDTGQCGLTTTLQIIVNPPLVVTVNNPTFCPGSSATMVATPSIPGTYAYTWTVPAGVPDPGNVASFTTTTPGTYTVVINQVSNFCNTDFETPVIPATANPSLINESLVPCWDTTASDGVIEMWPLGFEGVTAYSGNQLIELNANLVGTLFQDFIVIPGTTISVSFAHRGRQGNDVVGVEIGPVGGPYVSLGNFTDGNTAWVLHTVNYTIPTGSGNNYTLRFVSVSSTGGSPSIGNLLDSISISSLSCTSAPASGIATSISVTPVTTFDYPTPICQNATTNPLPGNFPSGFTTGGNYSEDTAVSTGLVFVSAATGEIDLINSTPGSHTIRYDVLADPSICQSAGSSSFTIVINPVINPVLSFSYTTPICQNAQATLSPTLVTGFTTGGTFSSTPGLSIDATTGVIDLTTSTAGSYTITYTVAGNSCQAITSATFNISINPVITPVTTFNYVTPVCQNSITNPIPNTSAAGFTTGGTYSSNPSTGIDINPTTGEIILANTTSGTYVITYTVAANSSTCQITRSTDFTIVINPIVNPVLGFSYTSAICQNTQATLSPTLVTGFTTGGTFSSTSGLSINGTTGVIDLATSTSGNYTITYTLNPNVPSCLVGGTNTFNIVINPVITPVTGFSYSTPFCSSDSVALQLPILAAGFTAGGTFSSTGGLSLDGTTGEINIPNSTPGVYTITYAIAANAATCQLAGTNSTQVMIIPPVTIELSGGCQSANYILTATPVNDSFVPETASYSWQNAAGTVVGNTQSITVTEIGIYTVTITVDGCSTESLPFDVTSVFCVIQKGISVNNDGLNDTFDLTGFDVKKLTIFNRLGMKVYSRNNYVDEWGGKSDDGEELPDGTYYYVIEQRSGAVKTGWIYINRAQ